jgi:RNA polymerase sigma-70 factor, ECF subfamily
MEKPDADLVADALAGSEEAAAVLFRRHWPRAWRTAFAVTGRRAAADDVAQDAFERAFGALDSFDRGRPFHPWLQRIVVNRALDLLRSERRLAAFDEPEVEEASPGDGGEPDAELFEALRRLPPERRALIVLRYWLDYEPAEIADLVGLPPGTVSSRLSRALSALRTTLEVDHVQ